jgi:hypothetical protein
MIEEKVKMKEIGGYFGLESYASNEYHKNLIPLNSGRNAIIYLFRTKNIKKLYIPYYLCNEIADILLKYNYNYEYYKIDKEFTPIFDKKLSCGEYLYIVNYYGQINNDKINWFKQLYNNIIIDNTHAFFQNPIEGIDTIYNCRKFFGVPDGAYLSTDIKLNEKLNEDISKDRMTHILGRYEGTAFEYYSDYKNNDDSLRTEPLKLMSKLTHNLLGAIDYQKVRKIRNNNYTSLDDMLGLHNGIKIVAPDGAFAYPFYMENGKDARIELAKLKIYVPTLWPNVLNETEVDSIEYTYVTNILPIPCDQRYDIEDMKYLAKNILQIKEKRS